MDIDKEREAFEAWVATQPRHEGASLRFLALNNAYIDFEVHGGWLAWQARASLPPENTQVHQAELRGSDSPRSAAEGKCGNEFAPFHPQASHVDPDYRDGWNACYRAAAKALDARLAKWQERAALANKPTATKEARPNDPRSAGGGSNA